MVTTGSENHTRYLHHDHLGSINTITDADRNIIEQRSFDAFGRVRQADWGNTLALLSSPITRGYTGHENIGLGLVHMNGRVYDPDLGRFLSPDPYIQAPKNLQSYNRYAYVINNPLSYTDPSGYFFKKARKKFKKSVKRATSVVKSVTRSTAQSVVNINGATLRAINSNKITGTIARRAACSYGPAACAAYVGASNYAETGSIGGSLKAGLIAGGTAYATQGVNGSELNPGNKVLLHAAVGGVLSVRDNDTNWDRFFNTAKTAAFNYLYNSVSRAGSSGGGRSAEGDIWNKRNVRGVVYKREAVGEIYSYTDYGEWRDIDLNIPVSSAASVFRIGYANPISLPLLFAMDAVQEVIVSQQRTDTIIQMQDYNIYEYDSVYDLVNGQRVNEMFNFGSKRFIDRIQSEIPGAARRSSIERRKCLRTITC